MKNKSSEAKSESDEIRGWIENPQTQVLRVELSDGSIHLCPYSWLVWVCFAPAEETDKLILTFNSHTISIAGKNLRELALAFQRMNVEAVKAQPDRIKAMAQQRMAFINKIEIEEISVEREIIEETV